MTKPCSHIYLSHVPHIWFKNIIGIRMRGRMAQLAVAQFGAPILLIPARVNLSKNSSDSPVFLLPGDSMAYLSNAANQRSK